jgi:SpoVK/Ycf46/Vps4 family AAA+-type ATPase
MPVLFHDERDIIPPKFDGDPGSLSNEDLARLAEEWEYILQLEDKKQAPKTSPETLEKLKSVTEKLRRRVLKVLKEMPKWTRVTVQESWDYQWPPTIVTLYGPHWGKKTLRG